MWPLSVTVVGCFANINCTAVFALQNGEISRLGGELFLISHLSFVPDSCEGDSVAKN